MSEKKNILIVSSVFPPEPVTSANLNYDLAVRLSQKHHVTVIHPEPSRPAGKHYTEEDKMVSGDFSVLLAPTYTHPKSELLGRMKESISFGRFCARYIRSHKAEIDFVYNCSWQLFGYYLVAKACVKSKIPYMIPIQDVYPETIFTGHHYPKIVESIGTALLSPIDRYYLRNATVIRTISEEMKSYLQSTRNLAPEQFLVVNNWQDDENYNGLAAKKEEGKRKTFVYVGSINAHSNVELIIRSFLNAKLDDAELLVYGGGAYKEKCQALVASAGADNVHFSYVERKEVPHTQALADVLVFALPKGNGTICLPSKLTSYMLSGRPVLASVDEDSTTAAYINQSGSGVVVCPDNLEALTSAFIRLSEMTSQQLEEMGRKSRAFALENLTREVNLSRVVSSVEDILLRTNQ